MSDVVLGINAYHADSAACILVDGRLIAAVEEERLRRIKHWAGFPKEAISFCMRAAGLTLGDVDAVAINTDPSQHLGKKVGAMLRRRVELSLIVDRLKTREQRGSIADELQRAFPNERHAFSLHHVEHHRAHLASAFYCSPFDEAVAVSVDGFGDFASTAWGFGSGHELTLDGRVFFPHSLGVFYQAITQYLGFPRYGDEYKVMGLAPYGRDLYARAMDQILVPASDGSFALALEYFRHPRERIDAFEEDGVPNYLSLYTCALTELLGPARSPNDPLEQRHKDIAHSAQAAYERAFFNLLCHLHQRYGNDGVALAGGCGMNSVANGKIRRATPFQKVYVQAAAGDAGGAIGAALIAHQERNGPTAMSRMPHAYWGPSSSAREIEALLSAQAPRIADASATWCEIANAAQLCARVADDIADGKVVGWFQGATEWGPRALGNRSILADPRRADMKEILNLKIKRRESFRPFAPSVLQPHVLEWFEEDCDSPFMSFVIQIRADKRSLIPAVTHVDGSGRLQTVRSTDNPLYFQLIERFHALTGVPMVLNTSFNENEPIVCRPIEALNCFLRTNMDVLVLGQHRLERKK